ncbi:bifunctional acetaldehyde-CoA/alcohol dehydrogenase [Haloplasma contractile]|uniref:Aldehyde-alcohol dehydrogenase n=1 Tax=Haloplasma contractile SSD-17B TaxID=1033810 RepID=U2FRQ0_9MOLU|nr:bifunctional acetaldehyde-CoA/alcohol dehydrogenase [Haloplasma contractile]ERJ13639.1 Aldehyde-alcohol dehydrogenase protein [Haloplasma contractile SSD-17B]
MTNVNVTTVEELQEQINEIRKAQQEFASFTQEQVDQLFFKAAMAINEKRIPLAKLAVDETGMGLLEDKVIKNHYASEYIYNKYRDTKTCGTIEEDLSAGVMKLAEPVGVIGAIIPTTNPTSTAAFKALMAIKTRNGIMFSPHPRAKNCTIKTAQIIREVIEKAGAPKNLISWITQPSLELTNELMKESDLILATGGPGMVKAAYSSGTPAIGVGAGNCPVIFHKTTKVEMAVNSLLLSKTFDNGVICASEQSIIVDQSIYTSVKKELSKRGALILNKKQKELLSETLIIDGRLNPKVVGQPAWKIAELAGFEVAKDTKVLVGEVTDPTLNEPFAHEKLSVVLAMYKSKSHDEAIEKAEILVNHSGLGHTAAIYADELVAEDDINRFVSRMRTTTVLINQPTAHGGIGDLFNFALAPSLTLGCGSMGNNSVSENVGPQHLLNIKTVTKRRENMLWFKLPKKTYYKFGSLPVALQDLDYEGKKRAFIVTDQVLFDLGYTNHITQELEKYGIQYQIFTDVQPDPTLSNAKSGAKAMEQFKPDTIIALGGGSAMDAAKIMWVLYEHPETNFEDLAMRFMDIRKRVYRFPRLGQKASLVCVATSAGTGSEVTPFSVITDDETGIKYPLADYELTPDMAIVDPALMLSMPKSLTAASGIDVLTHALESLVSVLATEYTIPLSLESAKLVFDYLPESYNGGREAMVAKEKMANASCIAGMAFSNAFLGICHSMAHKLGAAFKIPHGIANAMLMNEVIRFNATDAPFKMGTFAQYETPQAIERYAKFVNYLGLGAGKSDVEKVDILINEINKLKEALNIPLSIKDWGIDEEAFLNRVESLALEAFDDQCTSANPRYPLIEDMKQIFINAYYGK